MSNTYGVPIRSRHLKKFSSKNTQHTQNATKNLEQLKPIQDLTLS